MKLTGMALAAMVGMALGLIMYIIDKLHLANDHVDPKDIELKNFQK